MTIRMKVISGFLALIMVGTAAFAQGIPATCPKSPESSATAGLSTTDADLFMSVTDWSAVEFNKAFTYAGFAHNTNNTIDLGAAFHAGGIYLAAYYRGDLGFVTLANNQKKKKVTTTITEGPPGFVANTNRVGSDSLKRHYGADHTAVMLLGFGNIGINFGYSRKGENMSGFYYDGTHTDSTSTTDTNTLAKTTTTISPKGFVHEAVHNPFVGFGMDVALGTMVLRPTASVGITVSQADGNWGKEDRYTYNSDSNWTRTINQKAENNDYVGITGKFGVGLALGDELNQAFSFGYDIGADIYGKKKYTRADGKKDKIAGTYTITTDSHTETMTAATHIVTDTFQANVTKKTALTNDISFGYSLRKNFNERLSLLAGFDLPLSVTYTKDIAGQKNERVVKTVYNNMSQSHNDNTVTTVKTFPETTTATTTVSVKPVFKAALTYQAVPQKLFLNLGTDIKFLQGSHTTTKISVNRFYETEEVTTVKKDGSETKTTNSTAVAKQESIEKKGSYDKAAIMVRGGLRWNIVESVVFDITAEKNLMRGFNALIFDTLKLSVNIKF